MRWPSLVNSVNLDLPWFCGLTTSHRDLDNAFAVSGLHFVRIDVLGEAHHAPERPSEAFLAVVGRVLLRRNITPPAHGQNIFLQRHFQALRIDAGGKHIDSHTVRVASDIDCWKGSRRK